MSTSPPDDPEPLRVRTRTEFAQQLSALREHAGLTVRQVADKAGVQGAHSTIGDWFAGRGMPSISSGDLLVRVLKTCGVHDGDAIEQWLAAWRRARRAPGPRSAGPEPYRGLASFQPEDAEWFFGRTELTNKLITNLIEIRGRSGIILVTGASGSGKSSLLRAGIIPALRSGNISELAGRSALLMTPGSKAVYSLARQLTEFGHVDSVDETAEAIRADPVTCVEVTRGMVIIVDQFEEVFTLNSDNERSAFIAALCASADDPGDALVVLGLRADFYAQALRHPPLVAVAQANQLAVGPMTGAELRMAIVEPARKVGIKVEDGLVELLLREVAPRSGEGAHDVGVLPLLSHALYATWRQGHGRRMNIADYHEVGGIDGAVAASASAVYDQLSGNERELARRMFLSLVNVAPGAADTRRRVGRAELVIDCGEAVDDLLDRFVAQRLITADMDTVEISHEALLTAWPRLRAWLEADRTGLIVGRQLAEAASTWRHENDDPAALYRGTRLAAAQDWVQTATPDLSPLAREFLDASIMHEQDEQRAARRRTRRLRQLVTLLTVLLLLAATSTVLAIRSQQTATQERNQALSQKVAGEAGQLRATNPALAAQLALAAYRLWPTTEARSILLSTFSTPYATRLTGHTNGAYAATFSPDGHTLATAGADSTIRLWDVTDPHRPDELTSLPGHTGVITSAAFSLDGRTLATAGDDQTVRLWDVADVRRPSALATATGHTQGIRSVAFSPDTHVLATASYDMTARLWDITDPRHIRELAVLSGYSKPVLGVAFAPDGHTLATAHGENVARLWEITDPRHPASLATVSGHTSGVFSVAFSPDGHTLATSSLDDTARLWDITIANNPQPLGILSGHTGIVYSTAFSPDGHILATASEDRTARLWNISDPHNPRALNNLTGHADRVHSVRFNPDGHTVSTSSLDGTVRLWDVPVAGRADHTEETYSARISPDGRTLATAGNDPEVRLWDMTDPRQLHEIATLGGHTDGIMSVAFSPDGHMLATASLDYFAHLWDVTNPRRPAQLAVLAGHTSNLFSVVFSPDGHILATGSADSTVRLWDVTDPRHVALLSTLAGHAGTVHSVAFSPDGHTLVTGSSDGTTRLWDIGRADHPNALATIVSNAGVIYTVAFSPDGRTVATAGTDHIARLWDVSDPRRPIQMSFLTGHTNTINSVEFALDGRTLATSSTDYTARLWDISDPHRSVQLSVLTGHADSVNSAFFSPDYHTLVTASSDKTVQLWETDVERVTRRVCEVAYPPIAQSEWDEYFPGLAYTAPCPQR
ncbi:helix-turn-helix domain-containing protein [Actinocrispum sp. NPDC049592]|uniref:nSTAND1 domain-containing NTPase n=1 Tax=Actinocrispum sp. NPDC049592 TaxID=3154835 RepID=UPI003440F002